MAGTAGSAGSALLRLPALAGEPAALEQVGRDTLGGLRELDATCIRTARRQASVADASPLGSSSAGSSKAGGSIPGIQYLWRSRTTSPSPPESSPLGEVDRDHVGVDVHARHLPGGEQPAGELGGRSRPDRIAGRREALVTHPGERAVDLEPHDAGQRARLLDDSDRLTHGGRHASAHIVEAPISPGCGRRMLPPGRDGAASCRVP